MCHCPPGSPPYLILNDCNKMFHIHCDIIVCGRKNTTYQHTKYNLLYVPKCGLIYAVNLVHNHQLRTFVETMGLYE